MNEVTARSIVTGPITGGSRGRPFVASMLDVAAYGYTEAEYLLEGIATRYQLAPGADSRAMGIGGSSPPAQRRSARACSCIGRTMPRGSTVRWY